ncbi:MAG: EscU/YscU/HrcU family type III secretion system export apparatus switch protein [Pararobbsia sp.]
MSGKGRRTAVALAYDKNDDAAPRVVAKGYGEIAEMIVQRARDSGLYVHESAQMVSLLMNVDLDSQVPPLLYQAVAELLAWLYRLETGQTPEDSPRPEAPPRPGPRKGTRAK